MTQQMAVLEPSPARFANPVARYFAATRPAFLAATLVACLLGFAVVTRDGVAVDTAAAGAALLLALLIHAAVNVLNDYYDALNGTDTINRERLYPFTGGSRFIQNGVMTPAQTAAFGYALLAVAMVGGVWLAWHVGWGLLWIGAAGVVMGWAYSAEPFKLNSRGLGEACVLLGFLGVVVGADYVQRHTYDLQPWLIGLPYALLATNLLYINQFPDRKADAASGKRHWVVRLPLEKAVWIYPLLALVAFVSLLLAVAHGSLPVPALFSAFPLLFSAMAAITLVQVAGEPSGLLSAIRATLVAMLGHGIMLTLILFLEPQ